MTEDPEISRRYRSLGREEPPRHLDEAILAKARRAVASRGRWYFPVAAAAMIVLAVAVTLQVQKEEPAEEVVAMRDEAQLRKQQSERPATAEAQPPRTFSPAPAQVPAPAAPAEERKAADAAGAAAKSEVSRLRREAAPAALASSNFTYASPEQWLQGIADLRKQNRDDEADRQLAEFRKRYPDYRIPKEMLERVEMPK